LKDKQEARFVSSEGEMVIPYKEIQKKIKGYSEYFPDQFGREPYRLVYFFWYPITEEDKLKQLSKESL